MEKAGKSERAHGLTPREREVIEQIGLGWSGRQIAENLGMAYFTLRKHRLNILRKLGLTTAAQLSAMASNISTAQLQHRQDILLAGWARLTPRQREIVRLIQAGHSTKEIARILRLSPLSVATHRRAILKRLDVHSAAELCHFVRDTSLP